MDAEETFLLLQCLDEWGPLSDAIIEIDELASQIESLRERIQQAKDILLPKLVRDILQSASNNNFLAEAATFLYWNVDHVLPSHVKGPLGINSPKNNIIEPLYFLSECSLCHKTFNKPINSRAALKTQGRYQKYGTKCPECEQRQQAATREAWMQQEIEYKRRTEELRTMPYRDYLQTDHWAGVRKRALQRSNYRCQVCNTNKNKLHVHHRTYENRGQERTADVIVLCATCHETFHLHGKLDR